MKFSICNAYLLYFNRFKYQGNDWIIWKNTFKRIYYKLAKRIHPANIEYFLVGIKNNEVYPIIKDSGAIASLSFSDENLQNCLDYKC
ncbi:MAG: hypothetical protein LBV42_03370 [Methanobrevibacter sp.]|jgi:hypothetical protein|nr:hypothetical protein [Methanobrevibacter sp.]